MSKTTIPRGNLARTNLLQLSLTPASVAGSTSALQTFSVQDLSTADFVDANFSGAQTAGISIGNTRVSAANVLELSFSNSVTTAATPASGNYLVFMCRCEDAPIPASTV